MIELPDPNVALNSAAFFSNSAVLSSVLFSALFSLVLQEELLQLHAVIMAAAHSINAVILNTFFIVVRFVLVDFDGAKVQLFMTQTSQKV
jgi:hypothetical protein